MPLKGLSARVRGNPSTRMSVGMPVRSIRACGGTLDRKGLWMHARGLSARVRGNPAEAPPPPRPPGSIPARAGEPPLSANLLYTSQVYPRACGGTAIESGNRRSASGTANPEAIHLQWRHLWQSVDPPGPEGVGTNMQCSPCRTTHANQRDAGPDRVPAALDQFGATCACRPEPLEPEILRRGTESNVGRRHYVHSNLRRFPLSGGRSRSVFATCGGMVNAADYVAGSGDAGIVVRAVASAPHWDSSCPQRSGEPVWESGLSGVSGGTQLGTIDESSRQLFGQCRCRELLFHTKEASDSSADLRDSRRRSGRHLRFH